MVIRYQHQPFNKHNPLLITKQCSPMTTLHHSVGKNYKSLAPITRVLVLSTMEKMHAWSQAFQETAYDCSKSMMATNTLPLMEKSLSTTVGMYHPWSKPIQETKYNRAKSVAVCFTSSGQTDGKACRQQSCRCSS